MAARQRGRRNVNEDQIRHFFSAKSELQEFE
ncbi:hypothetical protein CCACVL1_16657 [Corchorus capsularis]|uniref:Uncharacterized protein n=1 Tax=Corchorus capsularis TaxID=210143 RepID=A0A1R3HW49_COCAP|nr:hypothetical protein CCACVL1_16657 [Corchorus capsularis]